MKIESDLKNDTVNQIKNVSQEIKIKSETQTEIKGSQNTSINSFNNLLEICAKNKEMKLNTISQHS